MRYDNQLEPLQLIDCFIRFPPEHFQAFRGDDSTPFFVTDYNLLTTLELALQRKIRALPLYNYWRKYITPRTCFIGTTVSEYALLPSVIQANDWIATYKQKLAPNYPFLIIKDLPQTSPLLSNIENTRAAECIAAAKKQGFIIVEGQALAYVPINFSSVDEYLSRLSKTTRKGFRRKLKSRDALEISRISTGDKIFSDVKTINEFYSLYLNVFQQSEIHFDKLTRDFFSSMLQDAINSGIVMIYRHQGELIGYNICFVHEDKLIDKYVGFQYPAAREHNLYFVSWFENLQYALDHRLKFYVAGWTDPEVKKSLGADFTFTCHTVYIRNPFIRALLKPFAFLFERDVRAFEAVP